MNLKKDIFLVFSAFINVSGQIRLFYANVCLLLLFLAERLNGRCLWSCLCISTANYPAWSVCGVCLWRGASAVCLDSRWCLRLSILRWKLSSLRQKMKVSLVSSREPSAFEAEFAIQKILFLVHFCSSRFVVSFIHNVTAASLPDFPKLWCGPRVIKNVCNLMACQKN